MQLAFKLVFFPHDTLCLCLIIPKVRRRYLSFKRGKPILCIIEIDMLAQQFQ